MDECPQVGNGRTNKSTRSRKFSAIVKSSGMFHIFSVEQASKKYFMDKFAEDIKGTIFFLASSVNQLIDLAEKNGLYPKGELDILREEQKAIFKEIYKNGNTPELWSRVLDIQEILKNPKSNIADDLWKILEPLEIFIAKYYNREQK